MFDRAILVDYWTTNVPAHLVAVIADQREKYLRRLDEIAVVLLQGCEASFHHISGDPLSRVATSDLTDLADGLDGASRACFSRQIQARTEAATFRAYFDLYRDCISIAALNLFRTFLKIGESNAETIQSDLSVWAEKQAVNVIGSYSKAVTGWVVDFCETAAGESERVSSVPFSTGIFEVSGRDGTWRAPKFLNMSPSPIGYESDDAAHAWDRLDAEGSIGCLRRLTNTFCCQLEKTVKEAAQSERLARAGGDQAAAQPAPNHDECASESRHPESENDHDKEKKPVQISKIRDRFRYQVIFGAIEAKAEGLDYCRILKERKLNLPRAWLKNRRVSDYVAAYGDLKLRQRIHDEKTKHHKQYELMSGTDRQRVIDGKFD